MQAIAQCIYARQPGQHQRVVGHRASTYTSLLQVHDFALELLHGWCLHPPKCIREIVPEEELVARLRDLEGKRKGCLAHGVHENRLVDDATESAGAKIKADQRVGSSVLGPGMEVQLRPVMRPDEVSLQTGRS